MRESGFHKHCETANISCINLNRSQDEKKKYTEAVFYLYLIRDCYKAVCIHTYVCAVIYAWNTVHRRFPRDANDVCSIFSLNLLCKLNAIKIKLQLLVLACTKAMHILTSPSEIKFNINILPLIKDHWSHPLHTTYTRAASSYKNTPDILASVAGLLQRGTHFNNVLHLRKVNRRSEFAAQ